MKLKYLAGAFTVAAFIAATPAAAERTPSLHVRCDGNPDNMSAGESAARLIALTAVVGLLVPPPEQANASARQAGAEGVAACDGVLAAESNDIRRAQLILARAIHRIEAGQFQEALADAALAESDRPELAATTPFRLSLHLSRLEIEAMALLAMGRRDEGAAKAMEMAAAAPYDLVNMIRAVRYVRLTGRYGPEEQLFYDRLIRLYPTALGQRAYARMNAGDFNGAADDHETWVALARTVVGDRVDPAALAHAGLARALAGQTERGAALIAQAREDSDPAQASSATIDEVVDLHRIWQMARDGRASEARIAFAARSSWARTHPAAVAEVARLLRSGARPEELTGNLAGEPAALREAPINLQLEQLNREKDRYAAIRPFIAQAQLNRFSQNVWRVERSRYVGRPNQTMNAIEISSARDGDGIPSGYAFLLHSALVARSRGKAEFLILPGQRTIYSHLVRFGGDGDASMFDGVAFNAEQVIADLTPIIPVPEPEGDPRARRRAQARRSAPAS